jgi:hypothetical protein
MHTKSSALAGSHRVPCVCVVFVLLQFPQIPHYNLVEATAAAKKVMGPYYR